MQKKQDKNIIYHAAHLVECVKMKPVTLVTISDCQACEYHDHVRKVREETPGKCPELFDVICTYPRAVRVHNLVSRDEALADFTQPRLIIQPEEVGEDMTAPPEIEEGG